jgi:tRNA dimethylallyltransferase
MSQAPNPANDPDQPLVIVLLGPTASGKTALGIELARALDLAVLSVDSRQLYQEMEIGTAKPTAAQRAAVRHELLDLRRPDQPINLQEFRAEAERAIAAEHARRGIALLVGGSGLYLKAITQGMTPPAVPPQPQLRAQLEALGQPLCHQLLRSADPQAGARIMANDAVRTQRALEVLYATGQPLSAQQGAAPPPWRVLELGLNPPDLKRRISLRSLGLYAEGLVEETRGLVERYGADCPLLDTIGYGEAKAVLRGELRETEAIALTTKRTQQFAKRQRTWFRRQHQPLWLDGDDPLQQGLQAIERVLG